MRKNVFSFSKLILAITLAVATMSTAFVGCKNYDDDIKKTNAEVAKLQTQIGTLDTALKTAQADAAAAKADAATAKTDAAAAKAAAATAKAEAIAEAKKLADEALELALEASIELDGKITELASKVEAIDGSLNQFGDKVDELMLFKASAEMQIAALNEFKAGIEEMSPVLEELIAGIIIDLNNAATKEELQALEALINDIEPSLNVLTTMGKRLVSMVFVPSLYMDGVPAIMFTTAKYNPLTVKAADNTVTPATNPLFVSNKETIAKYRLNPNGVAESSVKELSYVSEKATNVTRAAAAKNNPVGVVADQEWNMDENGVLALRVEKTVTTPLVNGNEDFAIVSLKADIADGFLFADEKESGAAVYSEYVRVAEENILPKIARNEYLEINPKDDNHYFSYADLSSTNENEKVSWNLKVDATHDLTELVQVCKHNVDAPNGHEAILENYKSYGFELRFYVDGLPYIQTNNTNRTDQQKFAVIADPVAGLLQSKVYNVEGTNFAATGREPIIRIDLVDTKNGNKIVDVRWMKIKFVKDDAEPTELGLIEEFTAPLPCVEVDGLVLTQAMNEKIYAKMNNGKGMTKEQFHATYTTLKLADDLQLGTLALIEDANQGTGSYNIKWTLTDDQIGQIVPAKSKVYTVKGMFASSNPDDYVTFELKYTITIPELAVTGHNGVNWTDNTYTKFKVNPIVYDPADVNVDTKTAIETDLLNGFVIANGDKPTSALAAIKGTLPACATAFFHFNTEQPHGYGVSVDHLSLLDNLTNVSGIVNDANSNMISLPQYDGKRIFTDLVSANPSNEVKVQLVVDLNDHNTHVVVKEYTVHFINPLNINAQLEGEFEDAVIGGSRIKADKALTFTDWNNYVVAKEAITTPTEKQKFAAQLYKYYMVQAQEWVTSEVKSNLKMIDGNLVPVEGVTDGPLPNKVSLSYEAATSELVYVNANGTPINHNYKLFVPVKVEYAWGIATKNVEIPVKGVVK